MITNIENIEIYKEMLETNRWEAGFFNNNNITKIKDIMEYVLKDVAKADTYEKACEILTPEFIQEHKIEKLFKLYKVPEMLPNEYYYMAWLVFPEHKPSDKELIIKTYKDVIEGRRKLFPSKYFINGRDPEFRAKVCFDYLCKEILKLDKEGIIATFGNSGGIKVLGQYKLKMIVDVVFESLGDLLSATYPRIYDNNVKEVFLNE